MNVTVGYSPEACKIVRWTFQATKFTYFDFIFGNHPFLLRRSTSSSTGDSGPGESPSVTAGKVDLFLLKWSLFRRHVSFFGAKSLVKLMFSFSINLGKLFHDPAWSVPSRIRYIECGARKGNGLQTCLKNWGWRIVMSFTPPPRVNGLYAASIFWVQRSSGPFTQQTPGAHILYS